MKDLLLAILFIGIAILANIGRKMELEKLKKSGEDDWKRYKLKKYIIQSWATMLFGIIGFW